MNAPRAAAALPAAREADLAARWANGLRGPLRLEDGRSLRVIFPGTPAGGAGPDFTGAILDAGGDLLRGDVEIHLRASGWHQHGHGGDPAYHRVVLHAVAVNDAGTAATAHGGRAIPVLVVPPEQAAFPPPFAPPCTFAGARGIPVAERLAALGVRRLRMKAARLQPEVAAIGAGPALAAALLAVLGGPANRDAFAMLARRAPLPALLEAAAGQPDRARAIAERLETAGRDLAFPSRGARPAADPRLRLAAAGALVARLWPARDPAWPLATGAGLLPALRAPGIGRSLAIELAVNAVLPAALASGAWSEEAVLSAWQGLPSPGVYGRLRPLASWLGQGGGGAPFRSAAALQGGLLLHRDYCSAGRCGRCPFS